jgi:spoIIIJ-associated protein
MRSLEIEGKNLKEAKQTALAELGVLDEAEVDFEVLSDVKGEPVRVRATLKGAGAQEEHAPRAADSGHSEDELGDEPAPDVLDRAMRIACEVAEHSGLDMQAAHRGNQGHYVHIEYTGPDSPILIEHRGEALDALQYLMNVMLSKAGGGARVILDTQNYRRRRADRLRELATSLATQVKERQEEAALDPLPAHERRIIHHALLEDDGVETYSEGNEPNRYVVISPKRR